MTDVSTETLAQLSATAQSLMGGMFITISLSIMLYGITTTQAYIYWLNFPNDLKIIRRTAVFVWVFETLHTVFCLHLLYNFVIINFGNVSGATKTVWSAGVSTLFDGTMHESPAHRQASVIAEVSISAAVQAFFVRRIWILTHKSVVITGIPAFLLVIRAGMGYCSGILLWVYDNWSVFDASLGPRIAVTSALTLAAATDLCIAVTLLYYLQKNRTGINETDYLIRKLQAYIINTGALTMVASMSIVLTFAFLRSSLLFMGLVQVQGKLYANSCLGTLNARSRTGTPRGSNDPTPNSLEFSPRGETTLDNNQGLRHVEILHHVTNDINDEHVSPSYQGKTASESDGHSAKNFALV